MSPALLSAPSNPVLRRLFGALLLLGFVACTQPTGDADTSDTSDTETSIKKREISKVRVASIEQRPMFRVLETTSKLESDREVQLIPEASGVVITINAEEGDRVTAGDLLAKFDDRDEKLSVSDATVAIKEAEQAVDLAHLVVEENRARVATAELASAQATRDYERDAALHEGRSASGISALSQKALEASRLTKDNADSDTVQAQIALKKAELDVTARENSLARANVTLQRAQVTLAKTNLRAPIDGVVAERKLRVGALAGSGDYAFVISDPDQLRAVFYRPQEEYSLFLGATRSSADGTNSLRFRATSEAWPDTEFGGWIERVSPTLDAESSQFRVTARFDAREGDSRLLPGMLVRLVIETDRHDEALVAPKRALRREGERRFVLCVKDDRVVRVDVTEELDFADDDFVEINALEAGALTTASRVIIVGSRDLVDGDEVTIETPASKKTVPAAEEPATAEPQSQATTEE